MQVSILILANSACLDIYLGKQCMPLYLSWQTVHASILILVNSAGLDIYLGKQCRPRYSSRQTVQASIFILAKSAALDINLSKQCRPPYLSWQAVQGLMKCCMLRYFIWIYTVYQSTRLGVSSTQRVKFGQLLLHPFLIMIIQY